VARVRHLNNAPIVEAMIDFRVRLPRGFDAEKFLSLKKEIQDKYHKIEKGGITGSIEIKDGKPRIRGRATKELVGYRFTSEDGKEVAQFRLNGLTFSRLHPYTKWEEVLDEARRLWGLYKLEASPEVLERIAVHYINRLDFALPLDYDKCLTAGPRLPKHLPQSLSQFLIRLVVHEDDLAAGIIQASTGSEEEGKTSIIIDIEAYKASTGGINDEEIWSNFERLRKLKNRIFFGLINEETARLYQ
jgi:uncharacterized protein (TIGR04255 family)